jgi:diaminopimelate decarboxylase
MPALKTFSPYRTEIAGHDVKELAAKFGTPVYVYDAAKIKERIDDLKAFDVVRYAQKACSNIAILDLMRRKGVVVDAVSAGEVARAVAAGYSYHGDPHPIIYTADIFDRGSLALVVEKGLPVNCGSPDMISQLGEAAPGRAITLRINPGFGHGHSQKTNTGGKQSKHGIWHADLEHCIRLADHDGLSIEGLHMHIGSGTDLEHLSQVCGAMEAAAEKVGRTIKTISAGGGLPIPYNEKQTYVDLDKYFELWDATRTKLEQKFGHKISLEIEPGRYLVAESGYLISEIRAIKQMDDNTFYLLDAGFNNLARPILYGSYHPMSIAVPESTPMRNAIVGGPLCESGDIFTQTEGGFVCARELPSAQVGDMLVIECAGAYGHVMASNYNSKPLTAEVLLEEGEAHLIRVRQTPQDILRGELIPAR